MCWKGKVMNVALETLGEEGLHIAADSQTEGGGTAKTKWLCIGGALMSLWVILGNIPQSKDKQFLRFMYCLELGVVYNVGWYNGGSYQTLWVILKEYFSESLHCRKTALVSSVTRDACGLYDDDVIFSEEFRKSAINYWEKFKIKKKTCTINWDLFWRFQSSGCPVARKNVNI